MIAIPTVRPVVDWRTADEKAAGVPLWEGDDLTVSELVKRDIVAEAQAHMTALREAVATLKAERAEGVARIAEIDRTLSELEAVAQPKRGRPRGKKTEPQGA